MYIEFGSSTFGVCQGGTHFIYLPFALGIDRLDKSVIITLAIDWMGMFTLITILNSCIRGRKSSSSNSFMTFTVVTYFILFFEVGTWICDRLPGYRTFNYMANIFCNVLMLVNTICYLQFVCESLGIDKKKVSGMYESVMIVTFKDGFDFNKKEAGKNTTKAAI